MDAHLAPRTGHAEHDIIAHLEGVALAVQEWRDVLERRPLLDVVARIDVYPAAEDVRRGIRRVERGDERLRRIYARRSLGRGLGRGGAERCGAEDREAKRESTSSPGHSF